MQNLPLKEDYNEVLRLSGVCYDSLADGEGVRLALYFSGCNHRCPGCHNPGTHDFESGWVVTTETLDCIAEEFNRRPYLAGITLTGGDPLYMHNKVADALSYLQKHTNRPINVWLYTGFAWEDISYLPIISMLDVVVDGPFVAELADKRLQYRGSQNQRIIDVQKSFETNEVVLYG